MGKLNIWKTGGLLLAAFAVALPASPSKAPAKPKLVVIVKADGALAELDSKDIQAIFLGDKQFQGGDKIEPLVNGNEQLNGFFLKKVLNKTKAQYKKIWSGKAFIDGLSAPAVLPSSGDVVREVQKNADAIGFVADKDITGDHGVKVIYSVDLAP
jgi:ABC-type phosphate transport system substrate-binding protein